jgi:N-acetylglucosaminyl-diphospho-decaprenol L-rhamnosyltransferase
MTDLAVIIVTWHVLDMALDALRTLYADLAQTSLKTQVIVVDNASNDGTVEAIRQQYPQVHIIPSDENLGFGRANNVGMKYLGFGGNTSADQLPKAVYLLNPDTLTQPGATQALYDALMADECNGLVGARMTYDDGSFQHSAFAFPGLRQLWVEFFWTPGRFIEGRFNGRYPRDLYHGNESFEVDFMLGATMMLRREVIQQTGMFDEQFFVYSEEVDWQWRIHKAGWHILCVPKAHIIHLVGQSTMQVKAKSVLYLWESRLNLFKKHYPAWKLLLAKRLIAVGMQCKIQQARRDKLNADVIEAYQTVQGMMLS